MGTSFERSLYQHPFGKNSFKLSSSISPGYTKMERYWNLHPYSIFHAARLYIEGLSNVFPKLLTTFAIRKYRVWARSSPFCI